MSEIRRQRHDLEPKGKKKEDGIGFEMDMPVLRAYKENFSKKKPPGGVKIATCLCYDP